MGQKPAASSRRPDSVQLRRQWALLRLLANSDRWLDVKELATQLDCSKATIQRDLATLGHDFALVEKRVGKQKRRYRINKKIGALETVVFGTTELLALHAALKGLEPLAGAPFYEDLRGVAQKIRGFLAAKHNGGLDNMARTFLPHRRGYVDYARHAEIIDDLIDAIARHITCKITYRSAKRVERDHLIHPLCLVWHRGALYAFCRFSPRKEIGRIAVHRIESLEQTTGRFSPPRTQLENLARRSFGIYENEAEEKDVEILFSASSAWRIAERIWHPDQRLTLLPDGRLSFEIRTSARWEIESWVLGWGGEAELVRPVAWRDELSARARAVAEAHGGSPGLAPEFRAALGKKSAKRKGSASAERGSTRRGKKGLT